MIWDRRAFANKAVIVTGAATGIGKATSRRFAEHGADVMLVDLNRDAAEMVAAELRGLGTRSFAVQANVTVAAEVQAAVEACLVQLGKVDVLVNVAGGFPARRLVAEMSEEEWDSVVDLNLKGVFLCTRAVLPGMIERRSGRIVNVSSTTARANPYLTAASYAAAKAGVLAFTRHVAHEVGQYGITVNATLPGVTLSPRIRQLYDEERIAAFEAQTPLVRVAEPDDQADPILFLASDAARYITGAALDVSGGYLMT